MRTDSRQLLTAAGASGLMALAITLFVAWHGTPVPGDVSVIREFQGWTALQRNEGWINPLGSMEIQLPLLAIALAMATFGTHAGFAFADRRQRFEAIAILAAALALRFLTGPLKEAARAERPAGFDLHVARDFAGYGFPSGHVYSDVLVFGVLAVVAPVLVGRFAGSAVRVACLTIIVLAGPARMVVGAHWPSDVAGGYLWGFAALCLAIAAGQHAARRFDWR
jgi:undecaprenyl-diphosphatase